ncbi:MAG: acetyl-CoA carboxylase biotin carboxyl carrier protein [Phycisphaerae bacterium]|nr:acetyl-CoA carboxylase biotin carboxyl carrier protein [Phycisphaerae bacterium]
MDIETVRNLIQLMVDNNLAELEVQDGEHRVALKRQGEQVTPHDMAAMAAHVVAGKAGNQAPSGKPTPAETAPVDEDDGLVAIKSPMVGTFYSSQDPESPPFVTVGTHVDPESVVCIIEAMKVYNEIKAEVAGVVEKVLVSNEAPVEFGQPLFLVRPAS